MIWARYLVSLLDQQLYCLREGYWRAFVIPVPYFLGQRTDNKLYITLHLKLGEPALFRPRYSRSNKLVGFEYERKLCQPHRVFETNLALGVGKVLIDPQTIRLSDMARFDVNAV